MAHRAPTRALVATLLCFAALPAAAIDLPMRGTLGIAIPTLPVFEVGGEGTAAVNPVSPGLHLVSVAFGAGLVDTSFVEIPVTDPGASPIRGLQFTLANDVASFAEAGGGFGGSMPLAGFAKVCLFGDCRSAVANLTIPLDVIGRGGATTVIGAVNVTVAGAPWTTQTVVVGTTTTRGGRSGPGGARSATAQLGGRLNLVTPIYISTNIGAIQRIDAKGRLRVSFEGDPSCDVETSQGTYRDGETIRVTRLRIASQAAERSYRLEIYLLVEAGGSFRIALIDRIVTLGYGFDEDLAPLALATVGPVVPRASYHFGCVLTDTTSGETFGDEAKFTVE